MDLLKAKDEIASLMSDLSQMQADIVVRQHHLYTEAVNLARSVSVQPRMVRIVKRQAYRANAPAQTPGDYYKINVTRVSLATPYSNLMPEFELEPKCSRLL